MTKENKKDIFKQASLKLKKSRLLKILILSGILLANGKLSSDLIAEENQSKQIENVIDNPCITIICNESDKNIAKNLKQILYDFKDENETTNIIISSLEKYDITFKIEEENDVYNGAYVIGTNNICIPKNIIEKASNTQNGTDLSTLKRVIVHETIHMLQDKKGIFEDAKNMCPLDSSIIYTLAEMDAICKSYVATDSFWNMNSIFECLNNMIYNLEEYTKQGLYISKLNDTYDSNIKLDEVISKFNNKGFDDYISITDMISITKEKIKPELLSKIMLENEKYLTKKSSEKLIASNKNMIRD